jgi:hypothetical protein
MVTRSPSRSTASARSRTGCEPNQRAALLFLAAARVKFIGEEHVGALAGLAVTPLGLAALAGLAAVAIGACATQIRLHNPTSEARAAVLALLLAAGALVLQLATA